MKTRAIEGLLLLLLIVAGLIPVYGQKSKGKQKNDATIVASTNGTKLFVTTRHEGVSRAKMFTDEQLGAIASDTSRELAKRMEGEVLGLPSLYERSSYRSYLEAYQVGKDEVAERGCSWDNFARKVGIAIYWRRLAVVYGMHDEYGGFCKILDLERGIELEWVWHP